MRLVLLILSAGLSVLAEGVVVGPQLGISPAVPEGELLFAELNCAACHGERGWPARKSPALGTDGVALTPQYLRRFLSDPHAHEPGTTHPDLLHHLNGEKANTVEVLTHYLISEQSDESQNVGAEDYLIRQGRALYHTVGCVACHAPQAAPAAVPGLTPDDPKLDRFAGALDPSASVPLGDLARKTSVAQLAKFLIDPLKFRPSGRMPSLDLTPGEATSIAVYLLREQAAGLKDPSKRALIAGLKYQYFEETFGNSPNFDSLTPKASGVAASFDISARKREEFFGFRFSGSIRIPRDGRYTFFVESDDGGLLYIDGALVVDNGGHHAPQEKRGTLELTAGEHAIMATYFNDGAGFEFKVSWQPPEQERQPISSGLLSHYGHPMVPLDQEKFVLDRGKAAQGRTAFSALGCASCHEVASGQTRHVAKGSLVMIEDASDGCLADTPRPGLPKFDLAEAQRLTLRAALGHKTTGEPPPAEHIRNTLAQLNCLACHTRDGSGGPVDARLEYFRTAGEIDLGDEGRIPPHLTKAGGKLRADWMGQVLTNRGKVRPYMATRMPQFGAKQVAHLPTLFETADVAGRTLSAPETTIRDAKFGRLLVGQGGLSCIACHTFGNYKSLGIPAMDMTAMARRLKFDWFHRYLIDPPSLRPGTRMPSFWPGGEAVNQEILNGHTGPQINAIWAYLSNHPETDLPDGLVQGKKEILATTEPVIYRNFIAGAGTRAIGVGYPEKVNLAFDANNMRLAMIWQGPFIDGARHRSGRGEGFEPPLGNNIVKLPEGPPFAFLANSEAAWPNTGGKDGGYRMGGYRLDEQFRPTFFYRFDGIAIEESFEPVRGEIDAYFKRTLRLTGEVQDNLWFRAATGEIEEKNGTFVLNGKVALKFPGAQPMVRASGATRELLVPVRAGRGEAVIVEEIIW